jgi:hypothetical protein
MNYWYVARPNELFLDIDNVSKYINHARSRLQGAIECKKLDVAYIMQRSSRNSQHMHVIISLNSLMDDIEASIWEVMLHGDIYRGCCSVMRGIRRVKSPRVLISPYNHFGTIDYPPDGSVEAIVRMRDDLCDCKSKHDMKTMESCPAAKRLRGEFRAVGFFGKPSKNPCTIWPEL